MTHSIRKISAAVLSAAVMLSQSVSVSATDCDQLFGNASKWLESSCGESCGEGCGAGCGGSSCGLFGTDPGSPVQFNMSLVQIYQGVVDGGVNRTDRYGGSGNYRFNFDLGRMGLNDGLSLMVQGDHQFGQFVAADAGVILPTGLAAITPTPETNEMLLTNFMFSQVVNENLTLMAGKLDLLDGDRNPFASGRGRTGFMNTAMLEPIQGLPIVPFVTVGAGAMISMDGNPVASLLVLDPTDSTTTTGLSDLFEDGVLLLGNVNLPISFVEDRMGLHSFNVAYSNKQYTRLTQNDPRVILPNVPLATQSGAWVAWWSMTQYIQQFDPKNDPMKGWGVFARFGVSDRHVAPITYWANAGLGGNSPVHGRSNDRWGVGWFYGNFSNGLGPAVTAALNVGGSTSGIEMFYNIAVTENFFLTPDLQVIRQGRNGIDTAVVAGIRAEIAI